MSEERYSYAYNRVLIDSARVLSPQFDDAVIYVTGAQLELLRNVTQYLNRLTTYATEIHPGYYLTPDIADFDDILEIVADLEETLMGNPNTIWGYKGIKLLYVSGSASGAGDKLLYLPTVPSGELWRLDSVYAWNDTTACSKVSIYLGNPTFDMELLLKDNPSIGEKVEWTGRVTIPAGSKLYIKFYDCVDGDGLFAYARGNSMDVPD